MLLGRSQGAEPPSPGASAASSAQAAEAEQVVDFWRTSQGLPHNTVNAVLQTHDGYLWVGTAAGLARFDGLVFSVVGEETAPGLKDAAVTALLEDREGALWVGTQDRGVFRLRQGRTLRLGAVQGLADDSVTSLAEDAQGAVWIGTQSGLNRWDQGTLHPFASPSLHAGDSIMALHAGRSGVLWITTRSGVFRLKDNQAVPFEDETSGPGRSGEFIGVYEDRSGNLWGFGATFLLNLTHSRRFNYFRSLELASSRVWTICEQGDGTFWIGTSGRGLFRFRGERFEVAGVREGLDQCDVRALYADAAGNLWIGTSGNGLARLRTRRCRFIGQNEGLATHALAAIAPDQGDQLWIGTLDNGLLHWDGRRVEPFHGGPPLDRISQIQSLGTDRQGALWIGTWGAGLVRLAHGQQQRFGLEQGLGDDVVLAVAVEPHTDAVWAGTRAGTLHRFQNGVMKSFNTAEGLTGQAIQCLLPGEDGSLIVGQEAGPLLRWDGKTFVPVPVPPELAAHPVRCLLQDRKGRLWAGTWGGGAFCRHGSEWSRLSLRQGLDSDAVAQICQDETGDFYFGTDENLLQVRGPEMEAFLRGARETVSCLAGIPEEELGHVKCPVGSPTVVRGTNGGLWLATGSVLLPLGARNRLTSEPPPPVLIEQALVNGRPAVLEAGQPLRLGPTARSLDFVFTAVSFTTPQKVRFRHKLENFDADWVDGGLSRKAHYGPLPPGQYKFRVIAANANGVWNEMGASQDFVVVPALWRSWWFLTVVGLAAGGSIWAAARFISVRRLQARLRIARQQHAMERERARIAQDMHDEIGSKLTRISFLSELARNPEAEAPPAVPIEAIASTSRELLHSLDEIVWAVNPRNDSLEQLAGYLESYAREYFQALALECEIYIPAQLPNVPLSAEVRHNVFLAFKEALNNVLKHAQATRVLITMGLRQEFEIRIQDNGRGFVPGAALQPEQNGLGNMQARLRSMDGHCEITSQPAGGTTVCLRFPLQAQELVAAPPTPH